MAIAVQMDYRVDLCKPVHLIQMDVPFFKGDKNAHRFHVTLERNGCAIDACEISATGYMVRADKQTVIWDAQVNGCDIYLTMPASCYAVTGRFRLLLRVTSGDTVETALWVEGSIRESATDIIVDPDNILPNLEELLAQIDDLKSITAEARETVEVLNTASIVSTGSGALVNVTDAAALPVQSLVSTIHPNTDGVSAVTLTHTGRNLISHLDYTITQGNAGTIITEDVIDVVNPSGYDYGKIPVALKGGATYTLVIDWEVYGRAEDATDYTTCSYRIDKLQSTATHVNSNGNLLKRLVRTYTATEDAQANILWYPNFGSKVKGCSRSRVMLLEGEYMSETAPAFEPGVKQTMTTSLPEAVYGGKLDWSSGLLTVTHGADGVELSEPRIIEIDQQTLKMFEGCNAVWSDGGDTSLAYVADTKLYIDNKFEALRSAILALGANV
jgi:hypothetical protein